MLPQLDAFAARAGPRVRDEGEPVVVTGNSLGGVVALRLAERADLPLAGVVPVAPAGLRHAALVRRRSSATRSCGALLALPVPIARPALRATVGEIFRRLAFARPRDAEAAVIAAFADHHADRVRVAAAARDRPPAAPRAATAPFRLRARSSARCCSIWGTRDRMVSHTGAKDPARGAARTREVELLEGFGHCPQLEATERVLELLLAVPRGLPCAA